jgi:hypothetical protein
VGRPDVVDGEVRLGGLGEHLVGERRPVVRLVGLVDLVGHVGDDAHLVRAGLGGPLAEIEERLVARIQLVLGPGLLDELAVAVDLDRERVRRRVLLEVVHLDQVADLHAQVDRVARHGLLVGWGADRQVGRRHVRRGSRVDRVGPHRVVVRLVGLRDRLAGIHDGLERSIAGLGGPLDVHVIFLAGLQRSDLPLGDGVAVDLDDDLGFVRVLVAHVLDEQLSVHRLALHRVLGIEVDHVHGQIGALRGEP